MDYTLQDTSSSLVRPFDVIPHSAVTISAVVLGLFIVRHLLTKGFTFGRGSDKSTIPSLDGGLPFRNAWLFFTRRYDFVSTGFEKVQQNMYQFNVNQHKIVVMRGEEARKIFFSDKELSFTQGYQILMGGAPLVKDLKVEPNNYNLSWFQRKITHMLRKDRLALLLPDLLGDLERRMAMWPDEGTINPFENIYDLVFQLTARAATCDEIASSPALVSKIAHLYWAIEQGSNARAMVFPWLPLWTNGAIKRKNEALGEMYGLISGLIEKRKKAKEDGDGEEVGEHDALQILIDADDSTGDIVQFVLGTLFAGVINTGINACWMLLFLAGNPTWRQKATTEIQSFITKYTSSDSESTPSLATRLARIPPNAWEDEMPVMECIIRECIRLILNGSALRRNIKDDLYVDGKKIEKGAFMVMPVQHVHMNEQIYEKPEEFDPGRFEVGRDEGKKEIYSYLGWGAGRHPCLGMRFAKLELKIIVALFLSGFEYSHVDAQGRPARVSAADVDRNDFFQSRPLGEPPFLKYKRVQK